MFESNYLQSLICALAEDFPTGFGPRAIFADISPGNIPEHFNKIYMLAEGGLVKLEVANQAGSVADVWDHDPETMRHGGKTHNYKPGDVIMTYGKASNNGKDIVDADGNQLLDQAVGDPRIIALTYVDQDGNYLNSGTKENPVLTLNPGATMEAKKKAEVLLLIVPVGTKVLSIEQRNAGKEPHVIKEGEAVCVGPFEDPYHTNLDKVLKKHVADPQHQESVEAFERLKLINS